MATCELQTRTSSVAATRLLVLKTVIVSPPMLVGFAGNVPLAMHTLRTLPAQPTNVDVVLPVLEEASRVGGSGPSGVDFVVAVGGQGLWRVTYRQIESKLTRTWIGDASAFSLYQEAYHSLPVSEPLRIPGISPPDPPQIDPQELEGIMRMGNAIASLHFGASTESVGEAFVSLTYSGQGFRYQPQAFLAAEHDQVVEKEGPWVPADWGTVAESAIAVRSTRTDRARRRTDRVRGLHTLVLAWSITRSFKTRHSHTAACRVRHFAKPSFAITAFRSTALIYRPLSLDPPIGRVGEAAWWVFPPSVPLVHGRPLSRRLRGNADA